MLRLKLFSAATFAGLTLAIASAQAADMPTYYEPVQEYGGWYLRGDIGITFQEVDTLDGPTFPDDLEVTEASFDESFFVGAGVGYRFNEWLRADVTGEFRFKSDFEGSDIWDDPDPPGFGTNDYTAFKEEILLLANGYFELGDFHGFQPFIGAGVGAVRISLNDFEDIGGGAAEGSIGVSGDVEEWNLAVALHAGVGYQFTENLTFEVAYRFLWLGDVETEDLTEPDGDNPTAGNTVIFEDITSHDIKFGLRYTFM